MKVTYSESNNDARRQAKLINTAVSQRVVGSSCRVQPGRLEDLDRARAQASIPMITLNSGSNQFKALGAITHVGQTETVAGQGAGERLKHGWRKQLSA